MKQNELKELASQLSCPQGEQGLELGARMNVLNAFITHTSIKALSPTKNEQIMEIGFANGELSLPIIQQIGPGGHFLGIETSAVLADQASSMFKQAGLDNITILTEDCHSANIKENSLDAILTVNVLYFIDDINKFFKTLYRWLNPGGRIVMGIRSKETLEKMPFTQFGFHMRSLEEYLEAMRKNGFSQVESSYHDEGLIQFGELELPMDTLVLMASKQ